MGPAQSVRGARAPHPSLPGELALEVRQQGEWERLYRFVPEPQHPVDLAMANWFVATHPESRFVNQLIATRSTPSGRIALVDLDYSIHRPECEPIRRRLPDGAAVLTVLERDVMDMEAQLQAARLLTWRAAWMMDNGLRNNLEASMAKAKAGLVVTQITQKAVELLGPLGYSRQLLLEKWMRDAKINDIFEGTQQINQMIVARRILGYSSRELS